MLNRSPVATVVGAPQAQNVSIITENSTGEQRQEGKLCIDFSGKFDSELFYVISAKLSNKKLQKRRMGNFPNLFSDRVTDPTLRHTADDETTGFNTETHAV